MAVVVLSGDDTRAGYSEWGSISSTAPPARRRDTRGQNGPQDTSSPPLRVLTRQWVVRLERCPAWQVLRRLLRCSPAERALGFQSAIPRSRNSGKSAWLGQGPPLGVSPPCGPMLRHNKVGQTVQVRADWRRHLVDGKLFDVWRRVVPAIWSCFLIRFGAATFSGPLGGCRRSCGIMNRMYAKLSSVLHRNPETTTSTSPWWSGRGNNGPGPRRPEAR